MGDLRGRKAADVARDLPVEEVLRRIGRPVPFVRAVNPSLSSAVTPQGWVTEPIGLWKGVPAEVVYDPGRHDVLVTRRTGAQRAQEIESRGFAVGDRWTPHVLAPRPTDGSSPRRRRELSG